MLYALGKYRPADLEVPWGAMTFGSAEGAMAAVAKVGQGRRTNGE